MTPQTIPPDLSPHGKIFRRLARQQRDAKRAAAEAHLWRLENQGLFECPHCGAIKNTLRLCCGELHSLEIIP